MKIGGTLFIINAISAENAVLTKEELLKELIKQKGLSMDDAGETNPRREMPILHNIILSKSKEGQEVMKSGV